ncbi:MAG: hypothetical protein R2795_23620 [Saprospiraceae bacterium]
MRLTDREIVLDSVLLKKGHRLDVGLELNALPQKNLQTTAKPKTWTQQEANLLQTSVFYWRNKNYQHQHHYLFSDPKQVFRYQRKGSQNTPLGIFKAGEKITYHHADGVETFLFEPGFAYEVNQQRERLYRNQTFYH